MEPTVHTPLPQLRAARATLHTNGTVASHLLRAPLARSWQRCVSAGLRPDGAALDPLDDGDRLRTRLEQHRELIAHAEPVLTFLHDMIRGSGSLCVLADADGVLLHHRGDDSFVARAQRVALQPGACWAEHTRGTNAIGTALAEGAPVVVHGDEHFLDRNGFLTCSAAPVFDSGGRLIGAVDVSGDHRSRHPHTLALVRSAARLIEDRLFVAAHRMHARVHVHPQAEGLAGIGAGMLAFAEDGRLVGANGAARTWFGLGAGHVGASSVAELLGMRIEDLLDGAARPRLLRTARGSHFFCRAEAPAERRVVASVGEAVEESGIDRARHRAGRAHTAGLTVLVCGESGTGKDVFARELHVTGPGRRGPFVAVNCASIPEALAEAELFGYVGGAFTGARREGAPGLFRQADGGTLFLDEIGDMPLPLQTRLLRVLEERCVTPLGSAKAVPVDVRLIGATHRDLREAVAAGVFRADLYYRVAGFTVELPPLRERDDFDSLCAAMLGELRPGRATRIAGDVAAAMRRFAWPGNLRQLRSVLTAAAVMLDDREGFVDWHHLPDDVRRDLTGPMMPPPSRENGVVDLRSLSDRAIRTAVAATNGNMSEAARRLGISRNTLYRRLRRLGDAP